MDYRLIQMMFMGMYGFKDLFLSYRTGCPAPRKTYAFNMPRLMDNVVMRNGKGLRHILEANVGGKT